MSKQIIIIGGGISGLSTLHYLKKKYQSDPDVKILLFEKDDHVGGTAHTQVEDGFLFEHGPNGFLSSRQSVLDLVKDLGLNKRLVTARPATQKRFVCLKNKLHLIPSNPIDFFSFQPLSLWEKVKIFSEIFRRKGRDPDESVYEFGSRRFGKKFAQIFLDAMVAGIFAGDARDLSIKFAFPRIYEIEQTYGSLFKGMMFMRRNKKGQGAIGQSGGKLISFESGISELGNAIREKYPENINTGREVLSLDRAGQGYSVETGSIKYYADKVFLCTPAYAAAALTKNLTAVVSELLLKIRYVPVAVVGLVYAKKDLKRIPKGFGYLIPSSEKKDVLGVLFSSNIFPNRGDDAHFVFRVMIGGSRNPDIVHESQEKLIAKAREELNTTLQVSEKPVREFYRFWPKAIPQYNKEYGYVKEGLLYELEKLDNLSVVANYLEGISLPDCIANAKTAVEKCDFSVENEEKR